LDGNYKVCRENCPVPTSKEFDDSEPAQFLAYELPKKTMPNPLAKSVTKQEPEHLPAVIETPLESPNAIPTFEIYFDFGMSKPNYEGRKALCRFAKSVELRENTQIELVGKTDDIGTQVFNHKLAYKRALYIETWLKSHGVRAQITISAKEECCRLAPYDKRELTLKAKRRVSIISHHQIVKEGAMRG
jgi:outer membrane protein OmpA-like peptidoglycan-associated protein